MGIAGGPADDEGGINGGSGTVNGEKRGQFYSKVFAMLSQKSYMPFTYAAPFHNIQSKKVHGEGVDNPLFSPFWEGVWIQH